MSLLRKSLEKKGVSELPVFVYHYVHYDPMYRYRQKVAPEELAYLKTRSMPEYFVEKSKVEDLFTIKVVLVPHEIQVITLTKE